MSKGLNRSGRVVTLAVSAALILALVALLAACGGSDPAATTTATSVVGSSTTASPVAGSSTTAAPPTTAGPVGASTTTTAATTPVSLSDADKTFMQTLVKSGQDNSQPLLDLGTFMAAYQTATDADVAKAEESIKKLAVWMDQIKAMTPSAGFKEQHAALVQALGEFKQGFTDFVAAVKTKDDAKIQAATAIITTASKKFQLFSEALGALANQ